MARPWILVSAHTEKEGDEFPDAALSLSRRYADAVFAAGGVPLVLPCTADQAMVREAVARCDGVLLTGGEDVNPALYTDALPPSVAATVVLAVGDRDLFELILIDETFRQRRPLLAICRGQQIVNVALGGDLLADLPGQRPSEIRHNRPTERFDLVHEVSIEPDSLLERIVGQRRLGVNSTHHQAVGRVAPPLRITGRGPDGIPEALELAPPWDGSLPFFLAVQFHPERLCDRHPTHAAIFRAFVEACSCSHSRPLAR